MVDAAGLMRVSYRQAKRLWKRYREEGAAGSEAPQRGAKHRIARTRRSFGAKVLRLVREKYGGEVGERFGPTLAAEHLGSEDGLEVDAETLRRWMLEEGLWSRERKRSAHRRRRERKEHFGELVQMDGSFHAWLEERGPEGCLMDMVDDATNTTWARLGEQETIWAVAEALRGWIERYGVPLALYVDWKNLYKRPANGERLRGEEPMTQFGRMCAKLGIEHDRRQFAAGEGAGGAGSRHASGPAGEETAAEGDPQSPKPPMCIWSGNICRNTTGGSRGRRPKRRTITGARRGPQNWIGFSGWRANGRSARTGWCGTTIGFSNLEPQSQNYAPAQSKVLVCEERQGRITIEYRGRGFALAGDCGTRETGHVSVRPENALWPRA